MQTILHKASTISSPNLAPYTDQNRCRKYRYTLHHYDVIVPLGRDKLLQAFEVQLLWMILKLLLLEWTN